MSGFLRAVLRCDRRKCGTEYVSDARSTGTARRYAAAAGWAVNTVMPGDGRRRYDLCPACKGDAKSRLKD